MNDVLSKLRKVGVWFWNQKEKMVLVALLIFLCFRVYVVLINPPDLMAETGPAAPAATTAPKPGLSQAGGRAGSTTTPKPAAAAPAAPIMSANDLKAPPARPVLERQEDYKPLVRQNPFTIYGVMMGTSKKGEQTEETIDVVLNRILKWKDGSYRAEMTTKVSGRPKYYAEGEPFESYKLMSIDAAGNTVTIYSNAHDKTFVLKVQ